MVQLGQVTRGANYRKFIWVACIDCGKESWIRIERGKPKSKLCKSCAGRRVGSIKRFGKDVANWKGGRIKHKDGYILVKLTPDDFFYPMASCQGYVLEHRLVVARALGRCLLPWETVHHKYGYTRDDNRYPEVLELLPGPHRHDALTRMGSYIKKLERELERLKVQLNKNELRDLSSMP